MKGKGCGLYGTQYVSAEPFPLSRGLLPRNPDGEGTDDVLVARIRVEVPTFCGKNTNQWVYYTPGYVSHRRVPLEWITDFLTFLKSCEIHHFNKKIRMNLKIQEKSRTVWSKARKKGRRAGVSLASSSLGSP